MGTDRAAGQGSRKSPELKMRWEKKREKGLMDQASQPRKGRRRKSHQKGYPKKRKQIGEDWAKREMRCSNHEKGEVP